MWRQTTGSLLMLAMWGTVGMADEVNWRRVQLDSRFRSEGVAVADVNHDGKMDVLAGDVWYAAPHWKRSEIRPAGDYWAGDGYSNSFANWAYDVNGDGWDDLIYIGFPGAPFHWYENPKNEPGHWKEHVIWHSACNETPLFVDITGDGRPEVVLGSDPEKQMGYLEVPKGEAVNNKWEFVAISEPGDPGKNGTFKYYHGLGATDCNGDGKLDVVIPHGWWEHPEKLGEGPWKFHEHALAKQAGGGPEKGADIYAEDLDGDGDADFMMSSAHAHGLWWFENDGAEQTKFAGHVVDELCSQTHAMHFVDINGDGKKDLVTGKRYFAHNGGDPGSRDPVQMVWYEIERGEKAPPKFIRHEIPAGLDTGIGTQFAITDMNADGLPDIVLSNKKGVNILLQTRTPK
ncbi:MAG: VCBS repeat-containing protein [Planctomycetaceae bacterium]